MSKVISLRLKDGALDALQRAARQMGRSPSEAAAMLLSEALWEREFAFIEFRDSPVGRQAYLKGTRLAVWQVVWVVRDYGGDLQQAATHFGLPPIQVAAAMRYAEAFPGEIEDALKDQAWAAENLERLIPNLKVVTVNAPSA